MEDNKMMKKMENGEKVIGMLRHVTIGLQYWSRECTPSWASDNEEEYTEVTEKYWRKHQMKRASPNNPLTTTAHYRSYRGCYGLLWPKIKFADEA